MEQVKLGVLFPVLNNWSGLSLAINSIRSRHLVQVHIIDNSFFGFPVAQAWNLGISHLLGLGCNYVVVANDDIVFAPCTLDALVTRVQVGDALFVTAHNRKGLNSAEEVLGMAVSDRNEDTENPDFSCFLITPACWYAVGPFDENFTPAYCEDNDYHARMALAGVKAVLTATAPYFHWCSQTRNLARDATKLIPPDSIGRNQRYFVAKWGHPPVSNPDEMRNTYFSRPFNDLRYTLRDWPKPEAMQDVQDILTRPVAAGAEK